MSYVYFTLLGVLLAEVTRALFRRYGKHLRRGMREKGVHLDTFKYSSKALVHEEIENDLRLNTFLLNRAKETGEPIEALREQVEDYIEEIVPAFNLLSYYKLGFSVANLGVNFLYTPVIDKSAARPGKREDVVIYMANHRSNMDYILVSYMLAQNIAVSYAVGEWARVFPLEYLFKSFGSYFVRRGEKDPLYHLVLELYVQLISQRAVSQGIFPEGGLSRDGKLRTPKVGLLDAISRITLDPSFQGDVLFVPVGINYDHVLEDRVLTAERKKEERPGFVRKLLSLLKLLVQIPVTLVVNGFRTLLGRIRRHGYAAVSFGTPISLTQFLSEHGGKDVLKLPRDERKPTLEQLAIAIMGAIAAAVPVTPVPLLARVLLQCPDQISREQLKDKVRDERVLLRKKGLRFITDLDRRAGGSVELADLEQQYIDGEEAGRAVYQALLLLERRRMVRVKRGVIHVLNRELLAYYAGSIDA